MKKLFVMDEDGHILRTLRSADLYALLELLDRPVRPMHRESLHVYADRDESQWLPSPAPNWD
jgi:hypothetical protein